MPEKENVCFSCPASLICETCRDETTVVALFCPECGSVFIRHVEYAEDVYPGEETFVGDFTFANHPEAQKALAGLSENFSELFESTLPCVVRGRANYYTGHGLAELRCVVCKSCDTTPNTT